MLAQSGQEETEGGYGSFDGTENKGAKNSRQVSLESEAGQFENSSWNWQEKHQKVNTKKKKKNPPILYKEGMRPEQGFQAGRKSLISGLAR